MAAGIAQDVAGGVIAFTGVLALLATLGPLAQGGEVVTAERPCLIRSLWIDPQGQPQFLYRGSVGIGGRVELLPGADVPDRRLVRSVEDPRVRGFTPDICLPGR